MMSPCSSSCSFTSDTPEGIVVIERYLQSDIGPQIARFDGWTSRLSYFKLFKVRRCVGKSGGFQERNNPGS